LKKCDRLKESQRCDGRIGTVWQVQSGYCEHEYILSRLGAEVANLVEIQVVE